MKPAMKQTPRLILSQRQARRMVASVLFSIVAIIFSSNQLQAQPSISIGAISILSGEGSSWGENHRRGTLLALEEVNAAGGINGKDLRVKFEDSPSGLARNALGAYQKLRHTENLQVILGPLIQDEFETLAPLTVRDNIFLLTPTYTPKRAALSFSTWIDVDSECELLAKKIFSQHKSLAILSSSQAWETQVAASLARSFRDLGGTIVFHVEPSPTVGDLRSELARLIEHKPSAIFISSYLLLPHYLRVVAEINSPAALYGIELDQTIITAARGYAEGLVFIAPAPPAKEFTKKFYARWHNFPDIPAASSYRAVKLLAEALRKVGNDAKRINQYFKESYQNYSRQQKSSFYRVKGGSINALREN